MPDPSAEQLLIEQIRRGDAEAWSRLIARYEGRLLAFVRSRLGNHSQSEDLVQETFLGLLISLPNYDSRTPLESFLFAIAAHKLTDLLRRQGRRPTIPLATPTTPTEIASPQRRMTSLMLSRERRGVEEGVLKEALQEMIAGCVARQDWIRLRCWELLFVRGLGNKIVATELGLTEQAVANFKFAAVSKLKSAAQSAGATPEQLARLMD